ncbi:MAG TPA: energy transducer TonB, partial [Acidobacteriaceae bacterium]|nr:energy transducer TonB [Acidobacteriaceae bacterium]
MKPAWFAAFAMPLLCTSLLYPQANPANTPATSDSSPDAKAAAAIAAQDSASPAAPSRQDAEIMAKPAGKGEELGEAELKARLTGRPLFLRGLWLGQELHFNMNGDLVGQSPKGSFTLCGVFVDKVRVTKKTVELEGVRFGVHFEGEAPWEQQATSFDRIQITPKKKHQTIVIDRQLVVIPKKKKGLFGMGGKEDKAESAKKDGTKTGSKEAAKDDEQEVATVRELPPGATTSPAESAEHLRNALNKIFAPALDGKMIAEMPDYWQYFYQAQDAHKSLVPTDGSLVHPGPGVNGPKILKNVVPVSNDYAQKAEVAGVASYKVILDPNGKILAVAVYRPIGFGLDENAVTAIQKSTFAPAVKDGKAVPSVIDVAVNFRIYSKRTAASTAAEPTGDPNASPVTGKQSMPGLYSQQSAAGSKTQAQS